MGRYKQDGRMMVNDWWEGLIRVKWYSVRLNLDGVERHMVDWLNIARW